MPWAAKGGRRERGAVGQPGSIRPVAGLAAMTRRTAIGRVRRRLLAEGVAAGMIALATAQALPLQAAGRAGFEAPVGEHFLTRVVRLQLSDGAMLVATRRYAIEFVAEPGGYRVNGRQIDVEIDAPARLGALAAIERSRRDDAMFPMHLDSHGQIVAFGSGYGWNELSQTQSALQTVEHTITRSPIAQDERLQALQSARMIAERITHWPRELFRPQGGTTTETRNFTLPDGGSGVVTIAMIADTRGSTLSSLERVVTTRSGGETRINAEEWRLMAAR
ncbi:MAG: hypothetical protein KGN34_13040 [Sphingomonadales bacterium]|nr:hypothetical protein [Sphingomonadales bacterium]